MEMVLLIGIPAACKSSFYAAKFAKTHVHVNLDTVKTRKKEQALISECLMGKSPFVIDNTNVSKEERARYITQAKESGFKVHAYFCDVSTAKALKLNQQRDKRVPEIAIFTMAKRLEIPTYEEGYDQLSTVRIDGRGGFNVT